MDPSTIPTTASPQADTNALADMLDKRLACCGEAGPEHAPWCGGGAVFVVEDGAVADVGTVVSARGVALWRGEP
jgi:hypothetical protein